MFLFFEPYAWTLFYIIPFIIMTVLVQIEFFGWATTSLIVTSLVMSIIHRHDIIGYIQSHGISIIQYAMLYVVLGVAWSFFKWLMVLMKFNADFVSMRKLFIERNDIGGETIPESKLSEFQRWAGGHYDDVNRQYYNFSKRPQAADFKRKIIGWASYWPCSIIGFVLNDPIRKLFNWLFDVFKGSYQAMADRIVDHPEFQQDRKNKKVSEE